MELRGFQRVTLQSGKKKTVQFQLTPDSLSLYDQHMHRVVVPDTFDMMVEPTSAQTQKSPLRSSRDDRAYVCLAPR